MLRVKELLNVRALCRPVALLTLLACLAIGSLLGVVETATAQVWSEEGTDVQAIVPDLEPPTAPVLIAPANTSSHTTLPQFVWEGATDNVAVTGYDFTVDGVDVFADLPTTSGSGAGYSLVVSGTTFTLTVTNPSLIPSGTHTWKVTARDAANNETDSSTWTFTLDGSGPAFVVDVIDEEDDLGIDAHDPSSVPDADDPITLKRQHASMSGTGEPGATFTIVICKTEACDDPDDEIATITGVVNPDGTWEVPSLPTLPRGKTVFMDITIEDGFGNTSVIENLPVRLKKKTVEVPPGWVITLIPPEEVGEEIIDEIVEWWTVTIVPILKPITDPVGEIIDEGEEVVQPIVKPIQEAGEQIYQQGSTTLTEASAQHRTVLTPVLYAHLMALVALFMLPAIKTLITGATFLSELSLSLLGQILLAVGFWPDRRPRIGIVVRKEDFVPLPGLVVEFFNPQTGELLARTVTDEMGRFSRPRGLDAVLLKVKLGREYLATPPRVGNIEVLDWYDNDPLKIDDIYQRGGVALPLTNVHRNKLTAKLLSKPKFPFISLAMTILITVITPTLGNLVVGLISVTLWAYHFWQKTHPKLTASVYYKTLNLAKQSLIRVHNTTHPGLYPMTASKTDIVALAAKTGHTRLEAFTSKWEYAIPEEIELKRSSPAVHSDLIVEPTTNQ